MKDKTKKEVIEIRPTLLKIAASCITGGPIVIDGEKYSGKEVENFGFDIISTVQMLDRHFALKYK